MVPRSAKTGVLDARSGYGFMKNRRWGLDLCRHVWTIRFLKKRHTKSNVYIRSLLFLQLGHGGQPWLLSLCGEGSLGCFGYQESFCSILKII